MNKNSRVESLIQTCRGQALEPRYLGYFQCFNQQLFFEAHEVLESLWLPARQSPNGAFFKGLIQLAGAFVHVQKGRRGPAVALLKLAQANLHRYPAVYESLDVNSVQGLISSWLERLQHPGAEPVSLTQDDVPHLALLPV
jgi:predicted metal-dependent hydrolase